MSSRDPKLVSRRVDNILNKGGAAFSHLAIAFAVALHTLLTDQIDLTTPIIALVLIVVALGLTIAQYINFMSINFRPLLIIGLNHFLAIIFILFMAPVNSGYFFVWLITVFRTDYLFGRTGSIVSVGIAALTSAIALFFRVDEISTDVIVDLVANVTILVAVSFLISNIREISDKERRVLVVSMDKAQLERQRLLSLVNSMGDAVIATDETGIISLYNGATLDILDTNDSLEGKNIRDYLKIVDEDGNVVDIVEEVRKDDKNIRRTDLLMKFSEADKINLYVSISPIKLGFRSNSERGLIMILRDITREKSLEEERDEFISVVSHELRTPITITEAEISNAQLINSKTSNDQKISKALGSAHKQIVFLANMMNDLATLSRAQRNDLEVELEVIKPDEMVKSLQKTYSVDAKSKGLGFNIELPNQIRSIITSRLYVMEVLQNFITNSLKYTQSGAITVAAEEVEKGIKFTVSDTGIGISKSDQKKLFEKFFRSEDYRTRESTGTGLGLYVTMKLARRVNGEISVSSSINKGSSFSLIVPPIGAKKSDHREVTEAQIEQFINEV